MHNLGLCKNTIKSEASPGKAWCVNVCPKSNWSFSILTINECGGVGTRQTRAFNTQGL